MLSVLVLSVVTSLLLGKTLSTGPCAPQRYDVVFLIDITHDAFHIDDIQTFFKSIAAVLTIEPFQTRIAIVTLGSTASLLFDFQTATSQSAVESQIDRISRQYSETPNLKDAIDYIRGTVYTTDNGDRADVSDVLIMLVSDDVITTGVDTTAEALKENGMFVMVAEEDGASSSLSSSIADVHTTFMKENDTLLLESTLTDIRNGFPCNYFCGSSFFAYDSAANLVQNTDSNAGYLYLVTDTPFQVTCCGTVSAWEFYALSSGTIYMMVFRPVTGDTYSLVGYTTIIVPVEYVNQVVNLELVESERIAIVAGDIFGWYTNGADIIGYADCDQGSRPDCPQNNKRLLHTGTFTTGESIDFSNATTLADKGFSIKASTANNTELALTAIQNETEIELGANIGYRVLYFRVKDADLYENITLELTGNHELFTMSEIQNDKVTLNLKSTLPPAGGGPYVITVTGTDSCQHTASATVTVSTYNAPPVINNLPYIYEVSETTKTSIHLYTINVTDATNDEICCTMPYTIPISYNFEFREENGVYSIWTVAEPAFSYNDIDSYRIFICCQDPYGSTIMYLMLRITENKIITPYVPPDWFYRAIAISMVPISLMTILAWATLVFIMFFLDRDEKREDSKSHQRGTDKVGDSNDRDIFSSSSNNPDNFDVDETIAVRYPYTDDIINIPIWRKRKDKNHVSIEDHSITFSGTLDERQPFSDPSTNRTQSPSTKRAHLLSTERTHLPSSKRIKPKTEFGVELKLFHFGGRPIQTTPEEVKAVEILQKKNEIKEKWNQMIENVKKKKEKKIAFTSAALEPLVFGQNNSQDSFKEEKIDTSKNFPEKDVSNVDDSTKISVKDCGDDSKDRTEIIRLEQSNEEIKSGTTLSIENENNQNDGSDANIEANQDNETLAIFDAVAEVGTAAAGTYLIQK